MNDYLETLKEFFECYDIFEVKCFDKPKEYRHNNVFVVGTPVSAGTLAALIDYSSTDDGAIIGVYANPTPKLKPSHLFYKDGKFFI